MTGANPFVKVWSEQDYRRLSVLMLVAGVAVSSAIPLVTLFLTEVLGVGESAAGLFFLTSLGAPLINLYTGALSDRMQSRVPLVRGIAVWLALGWALMSLSPHPAMAFAVGVVFITFIGALNAQIFAVLRDVVERKGERREASVMSTVRTGYSFGWTLGPVLGSLVAGWAGYRLAFALTAVLFLFALIPLAGLRVRRTQRDHEGQRGTEPARPREKPGVRLAVFGLGVT
jgi:MFS transporter, SET family, sugar efflux transporter